MKKKNIDFELIKEVGMVMNNEHPVYQKEGLLAKNYSRKYNKVGKFNFAKGQKGVLNLIVTPYVRKYQNEYGMRIGTNERNALAKQRFRTIMGRVKRKEY